MNVVDHFLGFNLDPSQLSVSSSIGLPTPVLPPGPIPRSVIVRSLNDKDYRKIPNSASEGYPPEDTSNDYEDDTNQQTQNSLQAHNEDESINMMDSQVDALSESATNNHKRKVDEIDEEPTQVDEERRAALDMIHEMQQKIKTAERRRKMIRIDVLKLEAELRKKKLEEEQLREDIDCYGQIIITANEL